MRKILMIIGLTAFILSACGTPATPVSTPTPVLTATPTLVPNIDINLAGTLMTITEINFGKYLGDRVTDNKDDLGALGGYEAKSGFTFVELIVEISEGALAQEVSNWAVTLQDSEGIIYEVSVSTWGIFLGAENLSSWTFSIPENADNLKLIFPEGKSVDLSPLIKK